jgi:hypothetical protein
VQKRVVSYLGQHNGGGAACKYPSRDRGWFPLRFALATGDVHVDLGTLGNELRIGDALLFVERCEGFEDLWLLGLCFEQLPT